MKLAQRSRGFTLLEMMVVLTIIGMGAAFVVPALARRVDAINERLVIFSITDQLRQLPRRVRLSGVPLELTEQSMSKPLADGLLPLDLAGAQGLRLSSEGAAKVSIASNGTCKAAELRLVRGDADQPGELVARFKLAEITCALTRVELDA